MPAGSLYLSTVDRVPGYRTNRYLGLVTAEACVAPDGLKDLKSFIENVEGGRHPEFERLNRLARFEAQASLENEARELGANAIIGIRFEYAYLTDLGLLMISISGTGVTVEPEA